MTFENTNVKLADLSTDVSYGYTASANTQKIGPKFLRITDIQGGVVDWDEVPYCEIDAKRFSKNKLSAGDIVVARTGNSTGENYLYSYSDEAVFASYLIRFRVNPELANPYFVWLQMRGQRWWDYVAGSKSGSAQAGANAKVLGQFEFFLPERKVQDDVAKIFFGINEKIKLNTQTNQTLEQIAQAIFKSWFVDFEPVKAKMAVLNSLSPRERVGVRAKEQAELAAMSVISAKDETTLKQLQAEQPEAYAELAQTAALFPAAMVDSELGDIPEGWSISSIGSVCEFQNGYAFKSKEMSKSPIDSYKVFKMGSIKKGGGLNKYSTKNYYEKGKCKTLGRYLIKKGDLLMCMTDMKNKVALLGHTALMDVSDEYILNQRVGLLRTKNRSIANYPFLYILTNSRSFIEDLRSRANSGVQVNLSTKEIKETRFILPAEEVHLSFNKIVGNAQEQIFSLELENESLMNTRDTLLPKLLSGELTLPNTEEA